MKLCKNISGFTLIEVLIAMTIFGVVMVSVMMIFTLSTQISLKSDINREMQQNLKSVVETIAEDVRKNGINKVHRKVPPGFEPITTGPLVLYEREGIETGAGSQYFLSYYEDIKAGRFDAKVSDYNECLKLKNTCVMVKKGVGPLSNGQISFTKLTFYASNGVIPKVTIAATVRPSTRKGVSASFIEESELIFQTTISERVLQVK